MYGSIFNCESFSKIHPEISRWVEGGRVPSRARAFIACAVQACVCARALHDLGRPAADSGNDFVIESGIDMRPKSAHVSCVVNQAATGPVRQPDAD